MKFLQCGESLYEGETFITRMRSNWDYPEDKLESQYGDVTYKEWLVKEKERIESRGGSLVLWQREDGMICSTYGHEITVGTRREVLPKRDLHLFAM